MTARAPRSNGSPTRRRNGTFPMPASGPDLRRAVSAVVLAKPDRGELMTDRLADVELLEVRRKPERHPAPASVAPAEIEEAVARPVLEQGRRVDVADRRGVAVVAVAVRPQRESTVYLGLAAVDGRRGVGCPPTLRTADYSAEISRRPEAARSARHRPERRPATSRHARRHNGRSAAPRAVRREADDVRRKAPLTWRPTRVLPDEGVLHYRLDGPRNFGDNRGEHGHQYPRPRGLHHGADPCLGVRLAPGGRRARTWSHALYG
jgi:hypothetical protein